MEKIPSNWFEDFFHGVTLDLWRKAIPQEHTAAEAEFLIKVLKCKPGAHVLDVPCGNGRLSFELAKHGYRVTGVDISEEFIEEANGSASGLPDPSADADGTDVARASRACTGETPVPQFILSDMRSIESKNLYDAVFCFGNSFGFMEYPDMEKFLSGVARVLKPGARFIVNTGMAAESVLPDFEEQSCHEVGDMSIEIKERYNATESCVDSEYVFERNGTRESRFAKHWIYTAAEIRRMLERAGFEVLDCYGSLKLEPFKLGSRELFVVSEVSEPRAVATGS
jgi:cyclopropane fatty-acyl-phospholipid synthase-like methyltransferase